MNRTYLAGRILDWLSVCYILLGIAAIFLPIAGIFFFFFLPIPVSTFQGESSGFIIPTAVGFSQYGLHRVPLLGILAIVGGIIGMKGVRDLLKGRITGKYIWIALISLEFISVILNVYSRYIKGIPQGIGYITPPILLPALVAIFTLWAFKVLINKNKERNE